MTGIIIIDIIVDVMRCGGCICIWDVIVARFCRVYIARTRTQIGW